MSDSYKTEQAKKDIKNAFYAACIIASITFIGSCASLFIPQVTEKTGIDLWALIDVLLIGVLAYGLYKQNRFAALLLTIYFIINKVIQLSTATSFKGNILILSFVIIYYLIKGTIGAFTLHSIKQKEKGNYGGAFKKQRLFSNIIIGLAVVIGIVLVVLTLWGAINT